MCQSIAGGAEGGHPNKVSYPFIAEASGILLNRSVVGQKIFDFNIAGLAHMGMLPDLIADFEALGLTDADLAPLLNSAQEYVRVWKNVYGTRPALDSKLRDVHIGVIIILDHRSPAIARTQGLAEVAI